MRGGSRERGYKGKDRALPTTEGEALTASKRANTYAAMKVEGGVGMSALSGTVEGVRYAG